MSMLNFYLLGTPYFEYDNKAVKIERRKAVALLSYLVITKKRCSRDTLSTMFWTEFDRKSSRASLRRTLSVMTKALGKSWLEIERDSIKFVPDEYKQDAHHWLILHGRYTCVARKPRCGSCVIYDLCEFKQKTC